MTQQELADKIGVTRQTVNAIELGKYSPSLEVAFRIAAVFCVSLDQVFQYDGDRTASEKKKVRRV
jgi:putative transcriptional regulator